MSARTIKHFTSLQRSNVTAGDYLLKLAVRKNGTWAVEVVGRWAKRGKGYELVDASPRSVAGIKHCIKTPA
jgi:hypothetical protein